jgi:hypothetical protein
MVNNEIDTLFSLAFRKLLKFFIILFCVLVFLFIFATETN